MQDKSVWTPGSFKFNPKEEWGRVYDHHEAIISKDLQEVLLVTIFWDLLNQSLSDQMEV